MPETCGFARRTKNTAEPLLSRFGVFRGRWSGTHTIQLCILENKAVSLRRALIQLMRAVNDSRNLTTRRMADVMS